MTNLEREIPGYQNGNLIVRRGSEIAAAVLTRQSFSTGSKEHLQEAVTLWEEGQQAWIWSKHESDADGPLVGVALREGGFPQFSEAMVILMGDKILRKRFRGLVARSYPHIPVPQDGCINRNQLLTKANKAIPKILERGKVAFIFPEGTRSKEGNLQEAKPTIAHYLTNKSFVLPMVIEGSREVWPVEGRPSFFKDVIFHFGKPIITADISAEVDFYEQSFGRSLNKTERQTIIVDAIMRRGIAPLSQIDRRGPYSDSNLSVSDIMQRHPKKEKMVV
jgi:1-acyl-sn-glycerol-3-phosphate acyltransferase